MLSTNDAFDREVKRKLEELRSEEIPLDFLEDLHIRLNAQEKKKKKKGLFWFFMSTLFAAILFLTFKFIQNNTIEKTEIPQNTSIQSSGNVFVVQTKQKVTHQMVKLSAKNAQVYDEKIMATPLQGKLKPKTTSSKKPIRTSRKPSVNRVVHAQNTEIAPLEQLHFSTPISLTSSHEMVNFPIIPEMAPLINDFQLKTKSTSSNPAYPEPGILPMEKEKWVQTFGLFMGMSGIVSSVDVKNLGTSGNVLPDLKKYAEIRNAQERSTSSIDLSLRTSWSKHHFLVQTGLDYFEWGEQLKYDYNLAYDGVNRYSYVSIPLYLGYRQTWNKVQLSASVGSSVGCVIKHDGYYLQSNLTTISVEQARPWTSTGYVQLELSYVKDNYRFSIAPTYRRSLTPVINSLYTTNTYQSIGLQMGISAILK